MKGNIKFWTLAVMAFFAVAGCANEPAAVAKPVVVTPIINKVVTFTDGRYLVQTHTVGNIVPVPPGNYVTDGVGNGAPGLAACMWSRWLNGQFAGAGYADGPTTVSVTAGQQFEVRGGCTWRAAA